MKKKIIIFMLVLNLFIGVGYLTLHKDYVKTRDNIVSDGIQVSLANDEFPEKGAKEIAFNLKRQEAIKEIPGIEKVDFANSASVWLSDNEVEFGSGLYASPIMKNYKELEYTKGRPLENKDEFVISEKLNNKYNGKLYNKIVSDGFSKKKIVGVYKNDEANPENSLNQVYGSTGNESNSVLNEDNEYLVEELNQKLQTNYSMSEMKKIYGDSVKYQAYVTIENTDERERIAKDILKVVPNATIVSNDLKFEDVLGDNIIKYLIGFELLGVVLLIKVYYREKKQAGRSNE